MYRHPFHIAFIGSAGIPNRYGGFEAFAEHCAPVIARMVRTVTVTCDARLYPEKSTPWNGVHRVFIPLRANGVSSIFHDALAFMCVFRRASHIIVLGVSGGLWFPLFRLMCNLGGKKLIVNVDGIEWRRGKHSRLQRWFLRLSGITAQRFAHHVIYDNAALAPFLSPCTRHKSSLIAYPGDHVLRLPDIEVQFGTALTICRIEPENNLEMLIEGFLASPMKCYTIVGNWKHSAYANTLHKKYKSNPRIVMLDSTYDSQKLATLRQSCQIYLHGHSVGGTNPSLVEMLFYDCRILCFDVTFNRATAENRALYFSSAQQLTEALENIFNSDQHPGSSLPQSDNKYTADAIAKKYVQICVRLVKDGRLQ